MIYFCCHSLHFFLVHVFYSSLLTTIYEYHNTITIFREVKCVMIQQIGKETKHQLLNYLTD